MLKRNSMRCAAVFLAALASVVTCVSPALAAAPRHHDQVPGFYRMKVGELEVTALFDGFGAFNLQWLHGKKVTMDGVARALHEDPHMLDGAESGFLVNTGKLAHEDVVIAGPHMLFPSLGRLHKEGSAYSWAPVAFADLSKEEVAPLGEHPAVIVARRGVQVDPSSKFYLHPARLSWSLQRPSAEEEDRGERNSAIDDTVQGTTITDRKAAALQETSAAHEMPHSN